MRMAVLMAAIMIVAVIVMIVVMVVILAVGVVMPIMVVMVAHECLASLAACPSPIAGASMVFQEIKQGQIPYGSRKCRPTCYPRQAADICLMISFLPRAGL
jgi:hypothetical protein